MRLRGAALLTATCLWAGCVYYNALYNAEHLLDQGEHARLAGRDSLAEVLYRDVVRKAAKGYRDEPTGPWAADALLLLGRARLRLGQLGAAEAALARAEELAATPEMRMEARLYRGVALLGRGREEEGTSLMNEALAKLRKGRVAAEGHLIRGEYLLSSGLVQQGWWDLRQATAMDRGLRTSVALARARWAIHYGDSMRVHTSFDRLLAHREAGVREDTVAALVRAAGVRWGPGTAARLLSGIDTTVWAGTPRGRLRLQRARMLRAAGDTARADRLARRVADGVGDAATDARLTLARWKLAGAGAPNEVREVARILRSGGSRPEVVSLAKSLESFDALVQDAPHVPLAWFAAAEVAREKLGAELVARSLFLAYADAVPDSPWAPKALLAALSLTRDEGDRAWLRGRLERYARSPYVLAARGAPAPGIEDLEGELARRLQEMVTR